MLISDLSAVKNRISNHEDASRVAGSLKVRTSGASSRLCAHSTSVWGNYRIYVLFSQASLKEHGMEGIRKRHTTPETSLQSLQQLAATSIDTFPRLAYTCGARTRH
jgi:hypothetical protein